MNCLAVGTEWTGPNLDVPPFNGGARPLPARPCAQPSQSRRCSVARIGLGCQNNTESDHKAWLARRRAVCTRGLHGSKRLETISAAWL
jgi:hypothetical protein